ncbi:AraC family transcriptional regulator [soil metagenome]
MGKIPDDLCEIQSIGRKTRELLIHPNGAAVFARPGIQLAGISQAAAGFRFVRFSPNMGQYLICFRGSGRVLCDGEWMECLAGHAYLTPPGKLHAYEGKAGWHVGWITVEPGSSLDLVESPLIREVNPVPFERILHGLHEENSSLSNRMMLEHWVALLHHHCSEIAGAGHSSRLWRLWQSVQRDLGFAWTLDKLASAARLGPETLRLICRRETKRSPMAYVRFLRMQHAVSLLQSSQKVEFVARIVGYENSYAFSTAFKREMGRPPSAFQGRNN